MSTSESALREVVALPRSTPSGRLSPSPSLPTTKSMSMSRARRPSRTSWSNTTEHSWSQIPDVVSQRNSEVPVPAPDTRNLTVKQQRRRHVLFLIRFRSTAILFSMPSRIKYFKTFLFVNPPASKARREVANLTERKIHIPPYVVSKNLSVCLSVRPLQCVPPQNMVKLVYLDLI